MRTVTETTVFRIFLGTLLFSPLAFGTVETWSILIMEAGVFSALVLYFLFIKEQGGPGILKTPGLMPLAALLCYMLFQAIPLPPAVIEKISPATFALYRQSVWIADPGAWATLSLYPKGTVSEFLRLSSYAGAYLLTTQFLSDSDRLKRTVGLLSLFAAALAFFSIIQHLAPNGKIYWVRELTQGGIPFGPYVNRNHFAGLMGMLFPIVMVLFLLSRPSSREESFRKKVSDLIDRSLRNVHLLLGFGTVVVALSIFLSLSRGGILSLCVSLALLGFLLSRRVITRKGGVLLIATVIVILYAVGWFGWTPVFERFRAIRTPQGEISELRLEIWKDSLGIVRDFPLTGTGAGSFMHVYPAYRTIRGEGIADHAHNDYLELLTDGGIIGAGLFAWFMAAVLTQSYQVFLKRKDPYARHLYAGALAGITAFLLHSITDFNFFINANGLYLFLLLGLVVSAGRFRSAQEQPSLLHTQRRIGDTSHFLSLQLAVRKNFSRKWDVSPSALRRIIAWGFGVLLLLSVLFNTGQMLSSILRTEASRISLPKASPETFAYLRDTLVRASFLDPLEPLHRYWLGRAAAGLSDNISEQRNYLSAVRLSPSNAGYLQALGSALEKTGDTAAAGKLFTEGMTRAQTHAGVIRQYGDFLLRAGKKDDALSQFRTALALEPKKVRDYISLLVLEGLSDSDILSIIPEDAESRITFAEYLDATGSQEKALSAYEGAVVLLRRDRPESPGIYWRISQFASRKARISEALGVLQLAGERFPKDIGTRMAIAGYYEKLGSKDLAVAAYQKILSLDPENKTAKQRMRAITAEATTTP
ncbi:MAG: O-antigen ligase family protein [Nitrospirota bacterium]|nr:O-antigen ligase family protein [Nitrospirota bacterium]